VEGTTNWNPYNRIKRSSSIGIILDDLYYHELANEVHHLISLTQKLRQVFWRREVGLDTCQLPFQLTTTPGTKCHFERNNRILANVQAEIMKVQISKTYFT